MTDRKNIDKLVEDTLHSFDASKRAAPKPFLVTRVNAAIRAKAIKNIWVKISSYLSRPSVAIVALMLLVLLNATIIMAGKKKSIASGTEQVAYTNDEFAINVISIYDIENQEP